MHREPDLQRHPRNAAAHGRISSSIRQQPLLALLIAGGIRILLGRALL